ncbi:uncharacterized protein EDB93DRAFT_1250192 [Suillus bovinus]|uniref:uncharacterized protein n=1 Tax=Suillus bovinus TaxID=48563 RepID=UPI001B884FA0|nr:uncharacterized protein EDB93DRAFT_1250192 [Suillus bovinus]KAG2148759.1 hypothetical protein EDB93DRAFT_1250192 [Suillus bovinus]
MWVLFAGYTISGVGGRNSQKQRFEALINSVKWPGHITRIPKNLGENQTLKKDDEWRHLLTIAHILLWWSGRDEDDNIPDIEPPLPPNTQAPDFTRNCQCIYDAILLLCAAYTLMLPPHANATEHQTLNGIIKNQAQQRGSMMTEIAVYRSEAAHDNVRLPLRQAKFINLRTLDLMVSCIP